MKRTKYLAILVCAALLSALCAGGVALAAEAPLTWYYYGVSGEPDTLHVNFENGIELMLEQLRGYEQVAVRIGRNEPVFLDKNPDEDVFSCMVSSDMLLAVDGEYLSMELSGAMDGQTHVLWKVNMEHHRTAAECAGLRFLDVTGGASGLAGAENSIGLSVNGAEAVYAVAAGDGSFEFGEEAPLAPGDEVVFTVYDGENQTASCFQTLSYRVEKNGNLIPAPMESAEFTAEVYCPVLCVEADGQPKEYKFDSQKTVHISGTEIGVACPMGGDWSVEVSSEKDGGKTFEAQFSGPEVRSLSLEEVMPDDGEYLINVVSGNGEYLMCVVRDRTAPGLYLPGDDKLANPLQDGAVLPNGTTILVVEDAYGKDPMVSIGGKPVSVTPREIGQKRFLTFELTDSADGVFVVTAADELGNEVTCSFVMARTTLTLDDISSDILLTSKNPERVLSGTGEPGETVMLRADGGSAQVFAVVNENGVWSENVSAKKLGTDGIRQLALFYDGDEENAVFRTVTVDKECRLMLDACEAGWNTVSGETDAYAVVTLSGIGQTMTANADAQGVFSFALSEPLKANDVLTVSALDGVGNASAPLNKQIMARPVLVLDRQSSAITNLTTKISGTAYDADYVIIEGVGQRVAVQSDGSFSSEIPQQQANTIFEIYAIEESANRESEHIQLTVAEAKTIAVNVELPVPNARQNYAEPMRVKGYAFSKEEKQEFALIAGDAVIGSVKLSRAEPTDEELGLAGEDVYTDCFARFDESVRVSALPLGAASIKIADADGQVVCEIPIEMIKSANLPLRVAALLVLLAGFAGFTFAYVQTGRKMRRNRNAADVRTLSRDE